VVGRDLFFLGVPDSKHNEAAWAAVLPQMFAFLLPPADEQTVSGASDEQQIR
jgi:hypothetical protein